MPAAERHRKQCDRALWAAEATARIAQATPQPVGHMERIVDHARMLDVMEVWWRYAGKFEVLKWHGVVTGLKKSGRLQIDYKEAQKLMPYPPDHHFVVVRSHRLRRRARPDEVTKKKCSFEELAAQRIESCASLRKFFPDRRFFARLSARMRDCLQALRADLDAALATVAREFDTALKMHTQRELLSVLKVPGGNAACVDFAAFYDQIAVTLEVSRYYAFAFNGKAYRFTRPNGAETKLRSGTSDYIGAGRFCHVQWSHLPHTH